MDRYENVMDMDDLDGFIKIINDNDNDNDNNDNNNDMTKLLCYANKKPSNKILKYILDNYDVDCACAFKVDDGRNYFVNMTNIIEMAKYIGRDGIFQVFSGLEQYFIFEGRLWSVHQTNMIQLLENIIRITKYKNYDDEILNCVISLVSKNYTKPLFKDNRRLRLDIVQNIIKYDLSDLNNFNLFYSGMCYSDLELLMMLFVNGKSDGLLSQVDNISSDRKQSYSYYYTKYKNILSSLLLISQLDLDCDINGIIKLNFVSINILPCK